MMLLLQDLNLNIYNMINYKWYIRNIQCIIEEKQLNDIVYCIEWIRVASTIFNEKEVQTLTSGEMICSAPNPNDFTPYNELTYEQVCQWLDNGLNVAEINLKLDKQLKEITKPEIVSLPIPFAQ